MVRRSRFAFPLTFACCCIPSAGASAEWLSEPGPTFAERAAVRLNVGEAHVGDVSATAPVVSMGVLSQDEAASAPPPAGLTSGPARRFGDAATWRFNVLGFYGDDFESGHFFGGAVSFTYFMVRNFSVDFELGLAKFGQDGPDAWGGNFNILLRWHFLARDTWSLYVDGGVGFLKTNDDVPDNGSNYNFTPQLGVGASFDIGNDWRMMLGLRWHHISNADTADSNPGRDSLLGYAGISVPF